MLSLAVEVPFSVVDTSVSGFFVVSLEDWVVLSDLANFFVAFCTGVSFSFA